MSTTNNERADFEAWVRTQPGGTDYALHRRDFPGSDRIGEYVNPSVNFAWKALVALAANAPAAEPVAWRQFMTDVLTAAGLVSHGKQCKALGDRLMNGCTTFRAPPAPTEQWVSVTERLPEKNTEVLIAFAENTLPSTGQFTGSAKDHDGWCYPKENELWPGEHPDFPDGGWPTVTHWRDLPAPPQGAAKGAT